MPRKPFLPHRGQSGRNRAAGSPRFDQNELTAAHRKLPLGTKATVSSLRNGKTIEVKINDRGPYARGRILDLSKAAAEQLDMDSGTAPVRLKVTKEQWPESGRSG